MCVRVCVQARYLWRSVEGVSVENRLDHDESLSQVLPVEMMSVIRTLIWTVVEDLEEWRTPQVEHELEKRGEFSHNFICLMCIVVNIECLW